MLVSRCEKLYDARSTAVNHLFRVSMKQDPSSGATPSGSIQSVRVAFALVEELATWADPLGVSELARRLGHTKARVHRHLAALRELGFVEQDPATDRYRPGWKLFRLGMALADNFDLRRIARRHLLRLHDQVGQTVVLAMPAAGHITIVDAVQSRDDVAITVRPGSVIPAESSAMGRVILAFQERSGVSVAVAARLRLIRDRWLEVAVNERVQNIAAIAAPVFDQGGHIAASIGIVTMEAMLSDPPPAALAKPLSQAAAALSAELGSTRWAQAAPAQRPGPKRAGKRPR